MSNSFHPWSNCDGINAYVPWCAYTCHGYLNPEGKLSKRCANIPMVEKKMCFTSIDCIMKDIERQNKSVWFISIRPRRYTARAWFCWFCSPPECDWWYLQWCYLVPISCNHCEQKSISHPWLHVEKYNCLKKLIELYCFSYVHEWSSIPSQTDGFQFHPHMFTLTNPYANKLHKSFQILTQIFIK